MGYCVCEKKKKINFNDSVWDDVSIEAKDLIKCLLCIDPTKRYDTKKALQHPWLTVCEFAILIKQREIDKKKTKKKNKGTGMEQLMEQRKKEEIELKKKKQQEEEMKKKKVFIFCVDYIPVLVN